MAAAPDSLIQRKCGLDDAKESADRAARVAVGTVASELSATPRSLTRVVFCCFSERSAEHHVDAVSDLGLT